MMMMMMMMMMAATSDCVQIQAGRRKIPLLLLLLLVGCFCWQECSAFSVRHHQMMPLVSTTSSGRISRTTATAPSSTNTRAFLRQLPSSSCPGSRTRQHRRTSSSTTTALSAFLPPSGGPGGKSNDLAQIATTVLTGVGIVLFFISPLGALFFALFNSLLALAILLPIVGVISLNVWQYFNTVTGSCPNCTAPIRVLKDESPNVCFNCGSLVQAKKDVNNEYVIALTGTNKNDYEPSIFTFFEEMGGVRQRPVDQDTPRRVTTKKTTTTTIIDVDVERED